MKAAPTLLASAHLFQPLVGAILEGVRGLAFTSLVLAANLAHAEAPRGLRCLARYYAIEPRLVGRDWIAHLASGADLPWDDERDKTLDQALEDPDLQDMLARPYPTGPIQAITDEDHDPGRVRVDALFGATYDKRELAPISFLGHRLRVHRRAHAAFARVEESLRQAMRQDPRLRPWVARFSGTFVERKIAGTERASSHSYGISIDLDAARTNYWRWQRPLAPLKWRNTVPQALVDAFERAGFIWGGRWYHYDTMHFEYRPELFDPDCGRGVAATDGV